MAHEDCVFQVGKDIDGSKVLRVDLWYPRQDKICENNASAIICGLVDVRAADDLRIHSDFKRDGWVISQPVWVKNNYDEWREVFFAQAWEFEK